MSDTHQWSIQILGIDVIGDIIEANSTFYTGPFIPGALETIATIQIKNIGEKQGVIQYALYSFPGQANETRLDRGAEVLGIGGTTFIEFNQTIPDIPNEIWPLGIKVWGETESEPGWDLGGVGLGEPLPSYVLPVAVIGGLLVVGYLITKK